MQAKIELALKFQQKESVTLQKIDDLKANWKATVACHRSRFVWIMG